MSDAGDCGCGTCAACEAAAALQVDRAFTERHSQIRARMLASITQTEVEGLRPLSGLGTRSPDDPAIALIDAQAAAAHVLAWTAMRLADDATLGKTEDRDALVALARQIGYEPRPALAATTAIAFTLEDFVKPEVKTTIPAGTRLQSVPGQGELPQTFETDAAIEGWPQWNAIPAVPPLAPRTLEADATTLAVEGVGIAVKAGDMLLVWLGGAARLASVTALRRIAEQGAERTEIDFIVQCDVDNQGSAPIPGGGHVLVLGQRASAFGATAPDPRLMGENAVGVLNEAKGQWMNFHIGKPDGAGTDGEFDLDAVYPDAANGRCLAFVCADRCEAGVIEASHERSRADYALSARITRVKQRGINIAPPPSQQTPPFTFRDKVRDTAIYIETARALLWRAPLDEALPAAPGDRLLVRGRIAFPPGRTVILSGEAWAGSGVAGPPLAERAVVASVQPDGEDTWLVLSTRATGRFRSATLKVLGNVAPASHGESLSGGAEILGSGSMAQELTRFRLKKAPLAYVPAANARGYGPALEVRVGERAWDEAPTLYALPPEARAYTVRDVNGTSEIQFAGRLPSGTYNLTASYRTGGGTKGLVEAGRLSTIATPVLGIAAATNPLKAQGGSDAETIDDLRRAAPRSVRTLDRVVSLSDFEAFAQTYRGIGKALASEQRSGMRSTVVVTVADTALASPTPTSDTVTALAAAYQDFCMPGRHIRVEGFTDYLAVMEIAFAVEAGFRRVEVEEAVRDALGAAFGKPVRGFGQGIHASQVLACVQHVRGVRAVLVRNLGRAIADPFTIEDGVVVSDGRVLCPGPAPGVLAGLLSIDPARITFRELAA